MKVLLDTNIIIHREANRVLNEDIGVLFNWLDSLHYEKFVHPLSIEELETYKDNEIVRTIKAKIQQYQLLYALSENDIAIQDLLSRDDNGNSMNDTLILKELYNGRVDFLISEDKGIHKKAGILGISGKVYKIDSFIAKCRAENPDLKDYKVLAVKKEYFGNINIKDSFFDSFKKDYAEFENWFGNKSQKRAYICSIDERIKAFLYIKIEKKGSESYKDISPQFSHKKRLKIGTFKVTSYGLKLGERFLKVIFDNAMSNKVDEIYVTIFDKRDEQKRLIGLLEDWGFSYWGTKGTINGEEKVFVKDFSLEIADRSSPRSTFPFISKKAKRYIVPIRADYHTELFPDSILTNESSDNFMDNAPHRNAMKKVYISRSIYRSLNSGDIILFYLAKGSRYKSVISTIGIVESVVTDIKNEHEFLEICRKRSVFDNKQLKKLWNEKPSDRPFVVNFLYVKSLPTPKVILDNLMKLGAIEGPPRGFEFISRKKFNVMMKEAKADASYFIN